MYKKIFKKREGEEKVKWGWAMYDWANNVYSLVITTAIFPVFYNNLTSENIVLGGFSQGCMISLQTGIKRKDKINCIIGYSGRIISVSHLEKNILARPSILLMHGDNDKVVPVESLLESIDFFNRNNYSIKSKIFKNCEHRIPTEGSSLGLEFIKKNLY